MIEPIYSPMMFVQNYITRHFEYAADNFAIKNGHAIHLKSALIKLFINAKAPLDADPVYSAQNHDHPTLVERLQNIDDKVSKLKWKMFRESKN